MTASNYLVILCKVKLNLFLYLCVWKSEDNTYLTDCFEE